MKRVNVIAVVALVIGLTVAGCGHQPSGQGSEPVQTIVHYVNVRSSIPAISGQNTRIYVRERVKAGTIASNAGAANRVVLFVHGAGTPAEVAFDVPHQDYSWMAYLACAGFDVFSMEHTGYGTQAGMLRLGY